MYELAVAIAASGRQSELRGKVDIDEVNRLAEATHAFPLLPAEPRAFEKNDVVIMPERVADPLSFADTLLSPARLIVLPLAPTGLFGWPFVDRWTLKAAEDVSVDQVARPEHHRAMAALGIELWTPMPRMPS